MVGDLRKELSQIIGNLDSLVEVMLESIQIPEIKGKLTLSEKEFVKEWEVGKMNYWDVLNRVYYRWLVSLTGKDANASLIVRAQKCPATNSIEPSGIDSFYTNRVLVIVNNEPADILIRDYFWSKGWFERGSFYTKMQW